MLMLKAKTPDGDWVYLDVYDEQSVNISKQFSEVESINKPIGSFSLSFRLPATDTNLDYFGAFFDANALNAINPKRKREAVIEVDTIPVLRGFIQLKGTYTKAFKYNEYEVVVFGELLSLREKGDTQLSALDWSDYEHSCSVTNVNNSFGLSLFSGDIVYGVVERGQGMEYAIANNGNIYPASMTMFVRHKAIIDRCFDALGMTYQSDFIASAGFGKYYTPLINERKYTTPLVELNNPLWVALASDITVTAPNTVPNFTIVDGLTESAPFYDTSSLVDPTSGRFDAPYTGQYNFLAYYTMTGLEGHGASLALRSQSGTIVWSSVTVFGPNQGFPLIPADNETINVQFNVDVTLDAGIEYEFVLFVSAGFGYSWAGNLTIESGSTLSASDGTGFTLLNISQPFFDFDTSPATNFPRLTIAQYLNGLQRCFNLVFIPDPVNPSNLIIEPFNDYMDDGDIVDWSDKLHVGKDKDDQILPTTDIQKREILLSYSDERDVVNQLYQDAGRTYGRYLIEDTENDFASGKLELKSTFGAYPLRLLNGKLFYYAVGDTGNPVETKLKLVYYQGQVVDSTITLYDTTGTIVNYPYFGHYSKPLPDVADIDLNFGGELPQHPILANPIDNLYNTYWRRWVNELFSDISRKRIAHFRLSALDIYNARFNDRIWIHDSYWRILKIEADFNAEELTRVELIKVLNGEPICTLTPTTTTNGVIVFEDAAGDPATATETCCVAYGYHWNGTSCIQLGVVPPVVAVAPDPVIGGVELRTANTAASVGFEILTYRGAMGEVELIPQNGRIRVPYGSTMTFTAQVLISEYDKVNGITAVEREVWEGNLYLQLDNASPDFTAATNRVSRYGDGTGSTTLTVTNSGNALIFTMDETAPTFGDVTIVMRLDYVLASN